MTEPTIAEVLAKYPDAVDFVDAKGNEWELAIAEFEGTCLSLKNDNKVRSWYADGFEYCSIPGLRPKPKKKKVGVKGYTNGSLDPYLATFLHAPTSTSSIPATLSFEVEEPLLSIDTIKVKEGVAAYLRTREGQLLGYSEEFEKNYIDQVTFCGQVWFRKDWKASLKEILVKGSVNKPQDYEKYDEYRVMLQKMY